MREWASVDNANMQVNRGLRYLPRFVPARWRGNDQGSIARFLSFMAEQTSLPCVYLNVHAKSIFFFWYPLLPFYWAGKMFPLPGCLFQDRHQLLTLHSRALLSCCVFDDCTRSFISPHTIHLFSHHFYLSRWSTLLWYSFFPFFCSWLRH